MSIENITKNILSDAEQIAKSSLMKAENSKEEIINKAKLEAEAIKKAAEEKAIKDAESIKSRKLSAAELQKRKMMLSAKQEAIKKSFDKALEKLKSMPEEKYIKYLTEQLIKIPVNEGIIILNKKDREKIGFTLIKTINDKVKGERFKLSDKTIESSGGFVLKNGDITVNSTFETLLDSMKDELTNEVASALFK